MTELIITEKPSSAKKIAAALADSTPTTKRLKKVSYYQLKHNGKDILIASAVGHLYGLEEKNKKGWSYPVFDIEWKPSYKNSKKLAYIKDYVDTITRSYWIKRYQVCMQTKRCKQNEIFNFNKRRLSKILRK